MADAPAAAPAPKVAKPKAPKKAPSHPPISELIIKALVTLKERNGSSAIAIKKWIAANEKVRRTNQRIKESISYLHNSAVSCGHP